MHSRLSFHRSRVDDEREPRQREALLVSRMIETFTDTHKQDNSFVVPTAHFIYTISKVFVSVVSAENEEGPVVRMDKRFVSE